MSDGSDHLGHGRSFDWDRNQGTRELGSRKIAGTKTAVRIDAIEYAFQLATTKRKSKRPGLNNSHDINPGGEESPLYKREDCSHSWFCQLFLFEFDLADAAFHG